MIHRIAICVVVALSFGAVGGTLRQEEEEEQDRYDFRTTPAYAALTEAQRGQLAAVRRDFVTLWGALDMYADDHKGEPPEDLGDLVPHYLAELPRDPFATDETAAERELGGARPSVEGRGYRYRRGAEGNRAWCLSSVGLPEFPFLAERGNVGLYVCKGIWISGLNPTMGKAE